MDNELWRWVWVVLALVMGLGEMFTAGFFLLPFAIGAVLAAVAAWLDLHGAVQWVLFFGGTAVSMLVLRRFMGTQDRPDDLPVGANRYVGMSARVIEAIDAVDNTGRVRVESDEWRVVTDSGRIEEGSLVRITALHGTKLKVEPEQPPPEDYVPIAERVRETQPSAASSSDAVDASEPPVMAGEASDEAAASGQDCETATPRSD